MEEYKTNSDKSRQEQSEKKVEAVISGKAKTRKKGEMQKFADVFRYYRNRYDSLR